LYNRGVALQTLERLEEAIVAYRELVDCFSVFPVTPKAYYNQSIALKSLDRDEEALINCGRALRLAPLYPAAWYFLGTVFDKLFNPNEANISYKKALNVSRVFNNQQIEALAIEALHKIN
jgi:tetratricopeptide (TPR) repeat protein